MAYIALSPRGWRPRASVQYIPYIPRARVITVTHRVLSQQQYSLSQHYGNLPVITLYLLI